MISKSKSSGAANVVPTVVKNKKCQGRELLRSFPDYNGKDLLVEGCADPDTGTIYIIDPKMKGGQTQMATITPDIDSIANEFI